MCGRFGLTKPGRIAGSGLLDQLAVDGVAPDVAADVPAELPPRYNIAPSQPVLAVLDARSDGTVRRTLAMLRWGLVPRWAKDTAMGNRLANARAETLAERSAFRDAWARGRRCAILADVFYEWQDVRDDAADPRNADPGTTGRRPVARTPKPAKQPWAIRLENGEPFALAGLWESWRDPERPDDAPLVSCTLITTSPNALMRRIHDRMPVVLTGDALVE
ncbi:MAG TPA: SOS response-associated peptidase, partial [Gemmatimonadales bacterium]